jgi:hypothetical protein
VKTRVRNYAAAKARWVRERFWKLLGIAVVLWLLFGWGYWSFAVNAVDGAARIFGPGLVLAWVLWCFFGERLVEAHDERGLDLDEREGTPTLRTARERKTWSSK